MELSGQLEGQAIEAAADVGEPLSLSLEADEGPPLWRVLGSPDGRVAPTAVDVRALRTPNGKPFLRLSGRRGGLVRRLEVEPNEHYELSGLIRTRDLDPGRDDFFGARVLALEIGSFDPFASPTPEIPWEEHVLALHGFPPARTEHPWQRHTLEFRTGKDTRAILVCCVLDHQGEIRSGTVDFADLRFSPATPERVWDSWARQEAAEFYAGEDPPPDWRATRRIRATVGYEERPSILTLPDERVALDVQVPLDDPVFEVGLGPWRPAHEGPTPTFFVHVNGTELARTELEGAGSIVERRWQDLELDLGEYAGNVLRLELSTTGPAPGVWGAPRVRSRSNRPRGKNVILLSIDTLRADHLGVYGYERNTSPRLDALSEQGVLFLDTTSQAPYTLPAHVTLLSGQYPSVHGVQEHKRAISGARTRLLSEILSEEGYTTAAMTGGGYMRSHFGFGRGFEQFFDTDPIRWQKSHHMQRRLEKEPRLAEFLEEWGPPAVGAWISAHADERFFLFLHTYAVHEFEAPSEYLEAIGSTETADGWLEIEPWLRGRTRDEKDTPSDIKRRITDHYDAAIRYVDRFVGDLQRHLEAEGLSEDTLVVITSDHGKELYDHGRVQHGLTLYEELVRVPWILWGAGLEPAVVTDPVMVADVTPTILGLLGLPPDPRMQGVDVLSNPPPRRSVWSEVEHLAYGYALRDPEGWKTLHAVDHPAARFEIGRAWERYHLPSDPRERKDRYVHEDEQERRAVLRFRDRLRALGEDLGSAQGAEEDAETQRQLQALGYLDSP